MEAILIILVTGTLNAVCFFIGAKVGQMTSSGERITLPKVDITKGFREREERKEMKMSQNRYNAIMRNIDRYDGTSAGQEDIPD